MYYYRKSIQDVHMAHPRLSLAKLNGFPDEFQPNGKISTIAFIEASYEVIGIIESFGKLFFPVVQDMKGNVDRLSAHYKEDEKNRMFIEDMILSDEDQITHSWLLWLKRALEMIERFFWFLLNDDAVIKEKSENIQPLISQAYNEVLKPYHGFFLQNGFKVSSL